MAVAEASDSDTPRNEAIYLWIAVFHPATEWHRYTNIYKTGRKGNHGLSSLGIPWGLGIQEPMNFRLSNWMDPIMLVLICSSSESVIH